VQWFRSRSMQLLTNAVTGLFPLFHMYERRRTSICTSQTGTATPAFVGNQPFRPVSTKYVAMRLLDGHRCACLYVALTYLNAAHELVHRLRCIHCTCSHCHQQFQYCWFFYYYFLFIYHLLYKIRVLSKYNKRYWQCRCYRPVPVHLKLHK
jgi:hypothetical protein